MTLKVEDLDTYPSTLIAGVIISHLTSSRLDEGPGAGAVQVGTARGVVSFFGCGKHGREQELTEKAGGEVIFSEVLITPAGQSKGCG